MKGQYDVPIGRTSFAFEAVRSTSHLSFIAETACLSCGQTVRIAYGHHAAVYRVGRQLVGICCDDCLSSESRQHLAQLRSEREVRA